MAETEIETETDPASERARATPKPPSRWRRRLRRLAVAIVGLVASVALLGVCYQQIGQALDRRALAPPGRLIAIDGAAMHLHCLGEGAPTVILEAGATGFAQIWARVHPGLARRTRVCAYDRAGLGWSDEADAHDGPAIAGRLRALLQAAGERGPYVLVGHSLGGAFIRVFAARYPDEVVGLAFVDPSHPDQLARFPAGARDSQERFAGVLAIAAGLAHVGLIRLVNPLGRLNAGLPADDLRAARLFSSTPAHLRASQAELLAWETTMAAAREGGGLDGRPIVVISATAAMEGMTPEILTLMQEMHAEIAGLSPRGRHRRIEGANHMTILTDAAHAERLVEAIAEVIDEAASARP